MWYLKGHSFEQKTPTLGNVSLGRKRKILTSLITPKVNLTISPKKTDKKLRAYCHIALVEAVGGEGGGGAGGVEVIRERGAMGLAIGTHAEF